MLYYSKIRRYPILISIKTSTEKRVKIQAPLLWILKKIKKES